MDRVIQQTDYDALSCKISAISKGYLPCQQQLEQCSYKGYSEIHMEYLKVLKGLSRRIYSKINRAVSSSFPVMNYGTYLRALSIDLSIDDFLRENTGVPVQIINLGCGSDLRMIHLLKRNPDLQYIDIDFKDSMKLKKSVLVNSELFKSILQLHVQIADSDANNGVEDELITARYKLLSCDLKNLDRVLSLLSAHTSKEIPTLIITECVLCYIPQAEAQALVEAVISFYDHGKWVSYDPIGGSKSNDRFGSIMQNNLWESRQLDMPTLMIYNSKETYAQRFANLVTSTKIKTMWDYYTDNVSLSEKQRLKGLQFLDEIEELRLILSHYIILEAKW